MRNYRLLGYVIQTATVLLGIYFVWSSHSIFAIMLFAGTAFSDFGLGSVHRNSSRVAIKLLLLMYGVMLWLVFTTPAQKQVNHTDTRDSTLHARTRNIVPRRSRIHNYPSKLTVSKSDLKNNRKEDWRRALEIENSLESDTDIQKTVKTTTLLKLSAVPAINAISLPVIKKVFGNLVPSDFSDLKYRSAAEVKRELPRAFSELPTEGFLPGYKNPCWKYERALNPDMPRALTDIFDSEGEDSELSLACLPFAYILGQPKCGTSDLFERLKRHPDIRMPRRKEVRWFTRGEFTNKPLPAEGLVSNSALPRHVEQGISSESSIFSFTNSFDMATRDIAAHPETLITVDGGPHTLWWPTQQPDGSLSPAAIPAPQMIREMQPDAKFIITLADPVQRLYSDYYFLEDDRSVSHRAGAGTTKSAVVFHARVEEQIEMMKKCIQEEVTQLLSLSGSPDDEEALRAGQEGSPQWFRASQICAHDRYSFGKAGWGRLSIGMYVLYLEKWLEHFPPNQFLVVRLEDYDTNPKAYMEKIFSFLSVEVADLGQEDWDNVLNFKHANEFHGPREPILEATETLLRAFHAPYNSMLAALVGDEGFQWSQTSGTSLRERQIEKASGQLKAEKSRLHSEEALSLQRRKAETVKAKRELARSNRALGDAQPVKELHEDHAMDRHGVKKHFVEGDHGAVEPEAAPKVFQIATNSLRGDPHSLPAGKQRGPTKDLSSKARNRTIAFNPQSFSTDGLFYPADGSFNEWLKNGKIIYADKIFTEKDAGRQLCTAAFALDLGALKYLLWDTGVPANALDKDDANRNAFHCLCMVHTMADAHSKSQVFAILKGKTTWLTPYLQPGLPLMSHSVLSRDIINAISGAAEKAAEWLLRAGVDPNLSDSAGYTPLHHASVGGIVSLVRVLLEAGVDFDAVNAEGRTALHYAAAYGHGEVAGMLIEAGADAEIEDNVGTKANDIMKNPGPMSPADALQYLGIEQRPPRKIERPIHPEMLVNGEIGGWSAGSGGWGNRRLQGYEDDMGCDVDQYWASEITEAEVYQNYLARGAPVLIRGLIDDWPVVEQYTPRTLRKNFGDLDVQVSDIPYASKFGGAGNVDMKLSEYIDEVKEHRLVGGKHPWYVFRGHPIPRLSEEEDSLVKYDDLPTPRLIQQAFERMSPPSARGKEGVESREVYVNSQWALGGEGTGAPVHFHNSAWNALIYGAKKWILYPPHSMIMSNRQILEYFETDKLDFSKRGVPGQSCVQVAGDVMIIPESWGHGVLNLQESVAVATEARANIWRSKPPSLIISRLPNDNRKAKVPDR